MPSLGLRVSTPDDGPGIRTLLRTVFDANPKTDPDVFRWQYEKNPFGEAIGMVWDAEGEIVCHLARLPVPMRLGGEHVVGALSVDAATAPDYRGRSMYVELLTRLNEVCAASGIAAAISWLPSRMTAGPHMPRAWSALRTLVRPLSAQWWMRSAHVRDPIASVASRVLRVASAGTATVTDAVPAGLDALWADMESRVDNGIVRSERWWRWRYGEHPAHPYRFVEVRDGRTLTGAAAFSVRSISGLRVACLFELMAAGRRYAQSLVRAVAASEPDVDAIAARACAGTLSMQTARSAGLWTTPRRLERVPMNVNGWELTSEAEKVSTQPWDVAWGDLDSV